MYEISGWFTFLAHAHGVHQGSRHIYRKSVLTLTDWDGDKIYVMDMDTESLIWPLIYSLHMFYLPCNYHAPCSAKYKVLVAICT